MFWHCRRYVVQVLVFYVWDCPPLPTSTILQNNFFLPANYSREEIPPPLDHLYHSYRRNLLKLRHAFIPLCPSFVVCRKCRTGQAGKETRRARRQALPRSHTRIVLTAQTPPRIWRHHRRGESVQCILGGLLEGSHVLCSGAAEMMQ